VAPASIAIDPVDAVINTSLVNARSGPDIIYPVVVVLGEGEEYQVTGKNGDGSWYRLCCVDQKEIWAKAEFATTARPVDALPVAQAGETSSAAAEISAPSAAPVAEVESEPVAQAEVALAAVAPTAVAAVEPATVAEPAQEGGTPAFELTAQEAFPESSVVRVFLYVFSGSEALEGYTLRVKRDGVEQAVSGESFGGAPGMTWPIADERQRFQNFKVEFPGVAPEGTWSVELVKGGSVVAPAASFVLQTNDPNRELYVRYAAR
jgi:uncharacterized protein YraI